MKSAEMCLTHLGELQLLHTYWEQIDKKPVEGQRNILKREEASPGRTPGGSGQETPRWTAVSDIGAIGMPFQQLLARNSQIEALPLQYIFHLTVDHLWKGYSRRAIVHFG
ncbi:uncharacterized protein FAM241A isoform X2 [Anas acuta]|uniref:uncharacterized protein FAM241A isoform X2 n=1 Tax=Anas acuta TaxID=28680 RepID=UPI0035C8D007